MIADCVLSIFQKISFSLFLYKQGEILVLSSPSQGAIPVDLDQKARGILEEINQSRKGESMGFLDFSFEGFCLRGNGLYGVKQGEEELLLLLFPFSIPMEINLSSLQKKFHFTLKEGKLVLLLSQGLSNKEIAQRLGSSPNTIRVHLQHIYHKSGVGSRLELFRKVVECLSPTSSQISMF